MVTHIAPIRFITEKRYFFVFGLLFTIILFGLTYYYREKVGLGTSTPYRYYTQFGIYLPLIFGMVAIIISYLLLLLTHIIHLRQTWVKIVIYLVIYGFFIVLGLQLAYSEPRYTDLAIVLIDAYAFPLLIASSVTLVCVVFFSFFKR